jgi:hypothetical protein
MHEVPGTDGKGKEVRTHDGAVWRQCNDHQKMAAYLKDKLLGRYPHAKAEIYIRNAQADSETFGPAALEEMLNLFLRRCGSFQKPFVRFTPDHAYGLLCTICCANKQPSPCDDSQTCLMLRIVHDGDKDILIGKNATPISHPPAISDQVA